MMSFKKKSRGSRGVAIEANNAKHHFLLQEKKNYPLPSGKSSDENS
jgi:hypothetical protein